MRTGNLVPTEEVSARQAHMHDERLDLVVGFLPTRDAGLLCSTAALLTLSLQVSFMLLGGCGHGTRLTGEQNRLPPSPSRT